MKTNVDMVRKMGDFEVIQRTKDEMFNATQLLNQWNKSGLGNKKEMKDYLIKDSTKEFVKAIVEEGISPNGSLSDYYKGRDTTPNEVIGVYKKSRGGKHSGTWMSPILFIDFAMWLNPAFKVKVLKFVYDELIKARHSAGDGYVKLAASAAKLPDVNYQLIARAMNHIVFRDHKRGIRQNATEEQLKLIAELEDRFSFAIDMGYIKSQAKLMSEFRAIWYKMYSPKF